MKTKLLAGLAVGAFAALATFAAEVIDGVRGHSTDAFDGNAVTFKRYGTLPRPTGE